MSTDFGAVLIGVAYLSLFVVGVQWWQRKGDTMADDLDIGTRVQQRSAWRDEPLKRGTVTDVYAGVSGNVQLYAVQWDGGHAPQRGYMGGGLEREHGR